MFVSDQLQPQLLIILQVERSAATKMFVVLIAVANCTALINAAKRKLSN
jgi:hypothetical protein